ncbi:MAG: DUF3108 domain-containing protein [Balneolaceae bacterium]
MIRAIVILLIGSSAAFGQQDFPDGKENPPTTDELFSVKETFRYEVKYGFFKLGWVNVTLLSDTMYNGSTHKHMLTEMKSNSGIPFIGKELDQFHSLFFVNEEGLPVESLYWKDNLDENKYEDIRYVFDREAGIVHYKEEDDTRDTLALEEPATSGHVIFYFSRLFAGTEEGFKLPVYVTKKAGYISVENSPDAEERKYAAFEEPVMAYIMHGSTENIEGPFGFSGDFRAWFLADDLRVPLEARVKVFLGNVIIKIIEYTREEL